MDPMTQASNRDKVILTQGKDEEAHRKKDLEDHTRKVSHLTHPHGQAIEEVKEDSLHTYQFSGSQFGSPSDGADNNKDAKPAGANNQAAQGLTGSQGGGGEDEGQGEWMYEDTVPEDYEEEN